MYLMKGFAVNGALYNNSFQTTSPVGELSPLSQSFAKERTYYTSASYPSLTLEVFTSRKDGEYVEPNGTLANDVLGVLGWVYAEAGAGNLPPNTTDFSNYFKVRYGTEVELTDVGRMIEYRASWYPEFIEISLRDRAEDNLARIWFVNDSFEKQYDEYEANVTLPVIPIDLLMGDARQVERLLAEATTEVILDRAKLENYGHPYTVLRPDTYDWVDKTNPNVKFPVTFARSVWGIAGDNIDSSKEDTIDKILSESNFSREDWANTIPDLFRPTEFIISPMWDRYSIPNTTLTQGLYSSNVGLTQLTTMALKGTKGPGYTDNYIRYNATALFTTYKNLTCAVVGHHENRDGKSRLEDYFPDYLVTDPLSPEFKRMSPTTREFVQMLITMLIACETLNPNSSVELGYNRVWRDGVLYLSKTFNRVQYLVAAKYNELDSGD